MAIMMGGRVAEEIIFGHDKVTSGASSDIEQATRLAARDGHPLGHERKARARWPIRPTRKKCSSATPSRARKTSRPRRRRSSTKKFAASSTRAITKARQILTDKLEDLHKIGKALLEYETLSGDEIKALLRGEKIVRKETEDAAPSSPTSSVPSAGRPRGEGGMTPAPQPST